MIANVPGNTKYIEHFELNRSHEWQEASSVFYVVRENLLLHSTQHTYVRKRKCGIA